MGIAREKLITELQAKQEEKNKNEKFALDICDKEMDLNKLINNDDITFLSSDTSAIPMNCPMVGGEWDKFLEQLDTPTKKDPSNMDLGDFDDFFNEKPKNDYEGLNFNMDFLNEKTKTNDNEGLDLGFDF